MQIAKKFSFAALLPVAVLALGSPAQAQVVFRSTGLGLEWNWQEDMSCEESFDEGDWYACVDHCGGNASLGEIVTDGDSGAGTCFARCECGSGGGGGGLEM